MPVDNLPIAQPTSYSIRSLHEHQFKPSVMDTLYKTYGDGFHALDILRSLNRKSMVSNETMTAEEQGYDHRTITIDSTADGLSDYQRTIVLDSEDLDSANNYYPRVGFTVTFGNTTSGFTQARISSILAAGAVVTLTVDQYDQTKTSLKDLATAGVIAAGKEVSIGDSAFGVETPQPRATSVGTFERKFYAQIFKESLGFGGMELAKQKWVNVQGDALFNYEFARVEFGLDRQLETALIMGQINDNGSGAVNLTDVSSVTGAAVPVYKNKGIWTWIDELGGEVDYSMSAGFEISDFDLSSEYLESQGITNNVVLCLVGGGLMRRIENSGVDFVRGNEGGLNWTFTNIGAGNLIESGAPSMTLDIGFQAIKKGGVLYLFHVLPIFNNPFLFGINSYGLKDSGMMIPISRVKDAKSGEMIPNLQYKYVGLGNYSRERVVGSLAGMDGFLQQKFRYPLISEIDANNSYWLSHVMFPFMEANKALLIKATT